jgi:hypothetical protein
MKKHIIELKNNDYILTYDISNLEQDFKLIDSSNFKKLRHVTYSIVFLGYPPNGWNEDVDIFEYIDNTTLNLLKSGKIILIFDGTLEGYGYKNYPVRISLEKSAVKNNIDPKLIFFFTGNFKDSSSIINVISIYNIDRSLIENNLTFEIKSILEEKEKFKHQISEKIFLSLSRRNRFPRVLANFILHDHEIFSHGLISQDVAKNFKLNTFILEKLQKSFDDLDKFKNSLPWIADENNFNINDPMNLLPDLHLKTPFSIVNETLINSENNTSFFFSEKFLKPILAYQPMVIYGQPGINKKISIMGYKDYSSYFDLSFDDEEDDIIRFQKLLKSITPLVKELSTLNRQQRIEWRFKNQTLLSYNYNMCLQRKNAKEQMNFFANKVLDLIKSHTID